MSEINLDVYKSAGFSTAQMRAVEGLVESSNLHWIKLNPATGIYELVLDNMMLKDFRACPAYFIEAYVRGIHGSGRSWNLDFGLWFHDMMESYYKEFRNPGFEFMDWLSLNAPVFWNNRDIDFHAKHKEYIALPGFKGAVALIMQYNQRFNSENERIRIIGTEIAFGKNKEVPLGSIGSPTYIELYLSGRLDILGDDGHSIFPLDHKTMGSIKYDPTLRYEMDEGPTGYIFAVKKILHSYLLSKGIDPLSLDRNTDKILMNFISKSIPKDGDRFKRIPIRKTDEQLEAYRKRMLATGEELFRALVRFSEGKDANRNTSACTNWYMHDCTYLPIHRQMSKENEDKFIKQFYYIKPVWDTENPSKEMA